MYSVTSPGLSLLGELAVIHATAITAAMIITARIMAFKKTDLLRINRSLCINIHVAKTSLNTFSD
jgi:hypothetical protein